MGDFLLNLIFGLGLMDCRILIHPREIFTDDEFFHCCVVCVIHWNQSHLKSVQPGHCFHFFDIVVRHQEITFD